MSEGVIGAKGPQSNHESLVVRTMRDGYSWPITRHSRAEKFHARSH